MRLQEICVQVVWSGKLGVNVLQLKSEILVATTRIWEQLLSPDNDLWH